ncbi:MAG TPA: hypothetical protein VFA25_09820 [Actinomycetota bacterium]|nr:hypothetical protein [Actinomycetota bacterium]
MDRWLGAMLILVALLGPACTKASIEEPGGTSAASVEPIEGSDVARVTLSAGAMRRLDIQTAPVREIHGRLERAGKARTEIPYAAVLYDPNGNTWTYTNPEPRVFIRSPVSIERIVGSHAFLSSGPPAGTTVVTVGAAELLGTEYEVGEE